MTSETGRPCVPDDWYDVYAAGTARLDSRALAGQWHTMGLDATCAARWARLGFLPAAAQPWIAAGFDPAAAATHAERGATPATLAAERNAR